MVMRIKGNRLSQLISLAASLTYIFLVFWMHIWTLEQRLPQPGEPTTPHHQVCTWLGTSGEAGLVSFDLPGPPKPTFSICSVESPFVFVSVSQPSVLHARGPPSLFMLVYFS